MSVASWNFIQNTLRGGNVNSMERRPCEGMGCIRWFTPRFSSKERRCVFCRKLRNLYKDGTKNEVAAARKKRHQKKRGNVTMAEKELKREIKKDQCMNHLGKLIQKTKRCNKCGARTPLTLDHIVPLSKGGARRLWNIQLLCTVCNQKKADKLLF